MTAVADKLREARALIERGWCQEAFARGKTGLKVKPYGRSAVCFCAAGAVIRASNVISITGGLFTTEFRVLKRVVGDNVASWNDDPDRTQAQVLRAFDKAIELAESGQ